MLGSRLPQNFGQYVLLDRLGDDDLTESFLARVQAASGLGETLVIRRIRSQFSRDPDFAQVLLHEAQVASTFDHTNLVKVLHGGFAEGVHFLAVEYARGLSLSEVLKRTRGPVSIAIAIRICSAAAAALAYIHSRRSDEPLPRVHGGVCPDSILIHEDGVPKLLDFVIARAAVSAPAAQSAVLKGRFSTLAPEQLDGVVTPRTDLYALGVCLYQMLSGRPLFETDDVAVLVGLIARGAIEPLHARAPWIPEGLSEIVSRTLDRNPEQRYASAETLLLVLERFAAQNGVVATAADVARFVRETVGDTGAPTLNRPELPGAHEPSLPGAHTIPDAIAQPGASEDPDFDDRATGPGPSPIERRVVDGWPSAKEVPTGASENKGTLEGSATPTLQRMKKEDPAGGVLKAKGASPRSEVPVFLGPPKKHSTPRPETLDEVERPTDLRILPREVVSSAPPLPPALPVAPTAMALPRANVLSKVNSLGGFDLPGATPARTHVLSSAELMGESEPERARAAPEKTHVLSASDLEERTSASGESAVSPPKTQALSDGELLARADPSGRPRAPGTEVLSRADLRPFDAPRAPERESPASTHVLTPRELSALAVKTPLPAPAPAAAPSAPAPLPGPPDPVSAGPTMVLTPNAALSPGALGVAAPVSLAPVVPRKRSNAALLVVALLTLVVFGTGAWFLKYQARVLDPSPPALPGSAAPPQPTSPTPSQAPSGENPNAASDGQEPASAPVGSDARALPAPVSPGEAPRTPRVPPQGSLRPGSRLEANPFSTGRSPAAGGEAPDFRARARLFINTEPWSRVFIGGRDLGSTPIANAEVAPGWVRMTLVNPEGQRFTRRIRVGPGEEKRVFFRLE